VSRREPVPSVLDLPGPVHGRFRPDGRRSSPTRAWRPLRPARPPPPVLPLVGPGAGAPCAPPSVPASPRRRIPRRRLLRLVPDQPAGGAVRHRPPPVPVVPAKAVRTPSSHRPCHALQVVAGPVARRPGPGRTLPRGHDPDLASSVRRDARLRDLVGPCPHRRSRARLTRSWRWTLNSSDEWC